MTPYSGKAVKARARPQPVPGTMNKTEEAYAGHLRLLMLAGEVLHYEFEPLKLRLADKTFYTPDFMVVRRDGLIELHEVKGATHYYAFQPEHLRQAAGIVTDWLGRQAF